jgi:hypothetical protein
MREPWKNEEAIDRIETSRVCTTSKFELRIEHAYNLWKTYLEENILKDLVYEEVPMIFLGNEKNTRLHYCIGASSYSEVFTEQGL